MKKIIKTAEAPAPIGPYNQAILVNKTLYISGQIGIDPKTEKLVEGDLKTETTQVMKNLAAILKAANMTFDNTVKTTIFLKDMNDFSAVNQVYENYFNPQTAPARETVAVKALPKFVNLEIAMTAVGS